MTESSQHTSKPQVEVEASGGDDNKSARRGAIFIGVVLVGYIVYLVVTGQMGQFWAAMSSVQAPWLVVACLCMFMYLFFGIVAYAIAVWLDPNSPVGIRDLISVEASGIFFGNLTPMMMGSTPAQIYRLTKRAKMSARPAPRSSRVLSCISLALLPGALSSCLLACRFRRALWRHDAAVRL